MEQMSPKAYNSYVKERTDSSPIVKNMLLAFTVGGLICAGAEVIREFYLYRLGMETRQAGLLLSITLIGIAVLLTGLGLYHKIAKYAGAGTLVPITGFANSMAAPAIEFKSEGLVCGVACKMFIVAGPVLVYGTSASIIYGLIYWAINVVK